MAEQILPPGMAALLAPPDPQQQRLITLAALAHAGALNEAPPIPSMSPPAMPPTLSGAENAPPAPPRSLSQMGFTPPRIEGTPGGAMASPAEAADIAESARWARRMATEAAPFAIAGPVGRGIGFGVGRAIDLARRFPQLVNGLGATGAAGGMAAFLQSGEPTPVEAQRRPEPTDAVKALQREMQQAGYYTGPIDGRMEGGTAEAKRRYEADQQARAQAAAATQKLELEKTKSDTERESLRLQQEKLNKEKTDAERADQILREGSERMRDLNAPSLANYVREYAPMAALPLGMYLGYKGRAAIGRYADVNAGNRAARADTLASEFGQGDLPTRIGRLNQFYTEGGSTRGQAPFTFRAGQQPIPWESNPNAPAANQLYRLTPGANYGPVGAVAGPGFVEWGVGHLGAGAAQNRIDEANRAIQQQGPTEANIQNLEAARRDKALFDTLDWLGRGTMSGGIATDLKYRLTRPNLRPSIGKAETERGQLDIELNRQQPVNPGGGSPNGPAGGPGGGGARQTILPPAAGGPAHEPGVTQYRNPSTGEIRSLDIHGRWRGPHPGGHHGWTSEPPASWQRISENAPISMAEFLKG
jgi:hypothetical protein